MIIFVYGEDVFRSRQKLNQLKDSFCKQVVDAQTSIEDFEPDVSWDKLHQALFTFGFLATKRLVIVRNLLSQVKDQKNISGLLESYDKINQSDKIRLIFFEENVLKLADENKKLFEKLAKEKYCFEFKKMNPAQLMSWIKSEVENRGGQIDSMAVNKLAQSEGDNLWQISNILDALIAYKNGELIKVDDLDLFLTSKVDDNIFNLVDALVQGQERKALQLINGQLDAGVNWNYLLSMISRQFGILAILRAEIDNRGSIQSKDLAQKLKLHPFVVQKGLAQAREYSLKKISQIYQELISIDSQL
ncbi:MAG: DNA polymerase III subunit delta, partial [Patescibacteria group bacterium]